MSDQKEIIQYPTNDVIDIDLSVIRKKRFRIDHDDSRVIELNTSDLGILSRLRETYPKLIELANTAFKDVPEVDSQAEDYDFATDTATTSMIDALENADKKMRELIDYIFDSDVSDICVPSGSMYDPINGAFRFEHIIDKLSALYETNISAEMSSISQRVKKHTDKYVRR